MKHKTSSTTLALAQEIAALRQDSPADLKERWRALYCTKLPRRRDLLVRALAYSKTDLITEYNAEAQS